jgi:hypothetical protein
VGRSQQGIVGVLGACHESQGGRLIRSPRASGEGLKRDAKGYECATRLGENQAGCGGDVRSWPLRAFWKVPCDYAGERPVLLGAEQEGDGQALPLERAVCLVWHVGNMEAWRGLIVCSCSSLFYMSSRGRSWPWLGSGRGRGVLGLWGARD